MHRSCRGNVPWYLNGTVRVRHALQQRGPVGIGLYVAWRGFHLACVRGTCCSSGTAQQELVGAGPAGLACGLSEFNAVYGLGVQYGRVWPN
jgi:hypothetical protein